jgi:hypothetical protein
VKRATFLLIPARGTSTSRPPNLQIKTYGEQNVFAPTGSQGVIVKLNVDVTAEV